MTDAMRPTESGEFVAGPALTPSAPLLAWLQQQGRDKQVRLPVVITFGNPGRFSIGSAHVGVAAGAPPADAIRLKLDGTTLGVSLVDRVRGKCADKKQMTCVLWLDGTWGPLMEGGGPFGAGDSDDGRHPFTVRAVGDVVDPATATTAFVSR